MKKIVPYGIAILPFVCFIAGYILSNLIIGTGSHQAPHLIGMPIQDALKATSQNNVSIKLIAEKECVGIPGGIIINQKPAAGRLMKQNQAILVTISKQPPILSTPNFSSQTIDQILKTSKDDALKIKTYALTSSMPPGTCIGQSPQPSTALYDKKIVIYCAQEKHDMYVMPNFVGQELSTAINAIQKHEIIPTIIQSRDTSQQAQKGMVISQKPASGSFISIQKNPKIQLEVS